MRIAGIRVRVHPLFLALMVLALYAHVFWDVVILFLIVVIHEFGHVFAARHYGYHTEYVELLPFGGVARLAVGTLGWNAKHETVIAIFGPLMNMVLALAAVMLHFTRIFPEKWLISFITINLTIMFFNLLPGLPLDGGRIARAGLAITEGYEHATRVVTKMSFIIATVLMILGVLALWLGYADVGLLALGFFLLFSAYTVNKQTRYDLMRFLDSKRRQDGASAQPLRSLAVLPTVSIGEVATRFAPGAYHLIYVHELTERAHEPGGVLAQDVLEEKDILDAIFEGGLWTEPVSQLLL